MTTSILIYLFSKVNYYIYRKKYHKQGIWAKIWYTTDVGVFVPNDSQPTWKDDHDKNCYLLFPACTGRVITHQITEFNERISNKSQKLNFHTII